MLKRSTLFVLALALVIVALAPASAFATSIVHKQSNSNTTWTTTLTYTPSSSKDLIQKVAAVEVSSANSYRWIGLKIRTIPYPISPLSSNWQQSTATQYCKSQSFTFSPNFYVAHGSNTIQVAYHSYIYSWMAGIDIPTLDQFTNL